MRGPAFCLAVLCAGCASGGVVVPASLDRPAGRVPVTLTATAVPLNPANPDVRQVGAFTYAGGLEIRATSVGGLHELSDLRIVDDDRLAAVADGGALFQARLVFTGGLLTGLADGRLTPLVDQAGAPLAGEANTDAEGLAILAGGDWLVSFERNHRIWLYPADGGLPRAAPKPDAVFPANAGLEALTEYPFAGPQAYLAGGEQGMVWLCDVAAGCRDTTLGTLLPEGLSLTALAAYGTGGNVALLGRDYDPAAGNRIAVRLIRRAGDRFDGIDELRLEAPLTRDNFEGLAVVPRPAGALRIYLLSDDNASATQHTYLFAFDWRP